LKQKPSSIFNIFLRTIMKTKPSLSETINLIILGCIILCLGYLIGRLTTDIEINNNPPPIIPLSFDINQKVPYVKINKITNNIMEGWILDKDVRLVVGEKLVEIQSDRTFQVDVQKIINIIDIHIPAGMNYLASKKGKKYYSVYSKSGAKIKPANRIYFKTEQDAIQAGFKKQL